MKTGNIVAYIALLAAAALTLRLAAGLLRRHPLPALRHYLLALSAFFAAGFLRITGNYTLQELLFRRASPAVHAIAAWVFGLLALPFFALGVWALARTVLSLASRRPPPAARIAFFCLQGVLVAAFIGRGPDAAGPFHVVYSLAFVVDVFLLAGLLLLLVSAWRDRAPTGLRPFALLYAALLAVGFVGIFLLPEGALLRLADPAATFLLHLPPLLLLRRTLARHAREHPLPAAGTDCIEALLSRYGVSRREAEIAGLLLRGKSYREIEEELFISLKTVKSHAYNIYRKTGVRSRWQLLNLVRGLQGGEAASVQPLR